ncbi:MAG: HEAT repeat domain-containing protein, partial [Cyanobacteria bacterium J06635_10]
MNDALNYGDMGLDLVIDALQDKSPQIDYLVANLLKRNENIKGKNALLKHNPKLYFTRLEDWGDERYYDPRIGIQNPVEKTYIVDCCNLT